MQKINIKNCRAGDTFALKLDNVASPYNNKYIILIKYDNPYWSENANKMLFRAKITQNAIMPKTQQEIDKIEYIKILHRHYLDRFLPLKGLETYDECVKRKKNNKFISDMIPDKDAYLYFYHFKLITNKTLEEELIYLGNYNYENNLLNECKILDINDYHITYLDSNDLVSYLIKAYDEYNLKKSIIYSAEGKKEIEKNTLLNIKILNNASKELREKLNKN